jgi:hypothetical protein
MVIHGHQPPLHDINAEMHSETLLSVHKPHLHILKLMVLHSTRAL